MLNFDIEWLEAPSIGDAELRETWARLSMEVGDAQPCTVLDDASGSVRTSLYLPIYPLAEWFAYQWWRLFYESYSPVRGSQVDYHFRHSIIGASDGFILPDLAFYPMGDFVQLLWRPRSVRHAAIRFLDEGQACLEKRGVMEQISALIDKVVERLEARGIHATPLQEEWLAIRDLSSPERDFCRTAARLGIDPFNTPEALQDQLTELHQTLSPATFDELLAAASSVDLARAARTILRFNGDTPLDLNAFLSLSARVVKADWKQPWEVGYQIALKLREALKLGDEPLPDDASLAGAIGVGGQPLFSKLSAQARPTFSAITQSLNGGAAVFGVASALASNRRFSFCRALFPLLIRQTAEKEMHLVTSSHSPIQQAGRAFAAEFLAPRKAVVGKLGQLKNDYDRVDDVAKRFGVSSLVIEHQYDNLLRGGQSPAALF